MTAGGRGWAFLERLPGSTRGVLWMAAASAFYAVVYVGVRQLTEGFSLAQVVFFRAALGSVFMLPWVAHAGLAGLRTRRLKLHLLRGIVSYAGAVGWMYGIAHMPLADANALMFLLPLFTIIFAALLLKETIGVSQWAATAVGFAGALIIIQPGNLELSLPALATLFAAASFSLALVATKSLVGTENPNTIVFYLYTLMIPFSIGPAIAEWINPDWTVAPLFILLGIATVGAQQCTTRSFAAAPANVVVPVNYLQLPLIAVMAYFVFGQSVEPTTWIGAAVIFASTYYVLRHEGRRPVDRDGNRQ